MEKIVEQLQVKKYYISELEFMNRRLQKTIDRMSAEQAMMMKEKEEAEKEIERWQKLFQSMERTFLRAEEEVKKYKNCCDSYGKDYKGSLPELGI